uniref:Uncharacterized protein n=1 Tax=Acrobeloides nanus TaxID=290746 RepID=A0A914DKY2_9BILA
GYCCSLTAANPLTNETSQNDSKEISANETNIKDPYSILWSNDFPIGP